MSRSRPGCIGRHQAATLRARDIEEGKKRGATGRRRYVPVIQRHQLPLTRALHVAPTREGLATQNYYFIFLRVAGYHHHRSRIFEYVHRES